MNVPARTGQLNYTKQQVDLIKQQLFGSKNPVTDLELKYFLYVAKKSGLDPLMRQVYAIKRWDAGSSDYKMVIQTGIDGYRALAERTGEYGGDELPQFTYDVDGNLDTATFCVYRFVQGERCAYWGRARFGEYVQKGKDGKASGKWADMPENQLAKCAEAQALRKGFPVQTANILVEDEMPGTHVPSQPDQPTAQVNPSLTHEGTVLSVTASDRAKKKPGKVVFDMKDQGQLTATFWETPAELKRADCAGLSCRFRVDHKPNPKHPETPYINLASIELIGAVVDAEFSNQVSPQEATGDVLDISDPGVWANWLDWAQEPIRRDVFDTAKQELGVEMAGHLKQLAERQEFYRTYQKVLAGGKATP